ncbi:hypothetical protein V8C86DRAFT_573342 [Haematococcus lacustris]
MSRSSCPCSTGEEPSGVTSLGCHTLHGSMPACLPACLPVTQLQQVSPCPAQPTIMCTTLPMQPTQHAWTHTCTKTYMDTDKIVPAITFTGQSSLPCFTSLSHFFPPAPVSAPPLCCLLPPLCSVVEVVVMGSSLAPGGPPHNLTQAAVAGCALLLGPHAANGPAELLAEQLNAAAWAAADEAAAAVRNTGKHASGEAEMAALCDRHNTLGLLLSPFVLLLNREAGLGLELSLTLTTLPP